MKYNAAVTKLCNKVLILAKHKVIGEELEELKRIWLDTFQKIIPLEDLPGAFNHALANHRSSFPVNAFEILDSFHTLAEERKSILAENLEREKKANPVRFCNYKERHINIHADTLELVGGMNGREVVLPCPFCRSSAYHQRFAEEKVKYVAETGSNIPSVSDNINQLFAKQTKGKINFSRLSPMEIIDQILGEIGKAILNEKTDEGRGKFLQGYEILIRVKEKI